MRAEPFHPRRARRGGGAGLAAVGVWVGLAACGGESVGPGVGPDLAPAAATVANAVNGHLRNNPPVVSFLGLRGAILVATTPPPQAAVTPGPLAGPPPGADVVHVAFAAPASTADPVAVPAFAGVPDQIQGRQLIWDTQLDQYVIDPQDPGLAPANGARFRLYSLRDTNSPVEPLIDVGFLDLVDATVGSTLDVTGAIEDAQGPRADFQVRGLLAQDFNLAADGFFSDGTGNFPFTASSVGTNGGLQVTTRVDATLGTLEIETTFEAVTSGQNLTTFTVRTNGFTIEFVFSTSGNQIETGSGVVVDGTTLATISGTLTNPRIRRFSGAPISDASLDALRSIFVDVFELQTTVANVIVFGLLVNQGIQGF